MKGFYLLYQNNVPIPVPVHVTDTCTVPGRITTLAIGCICWRMTCRRISSTWRRRRAYGSGRTIRTSCGESLLPLLKYSAERVATLLHSL
jgi:hypothetical protein